MTTRQDSHEANATMAVYLDLENIALGARDAQIAPFDIQKVLERLLIKGNIVVKKAYCDFERYKELKRDLHEAAFEMIEIPHVRQSGKNSADIRMVVDALDLCYTKSHVDTFVVISGDSDFSPLVSKLRENAKKVIGVGVKRSTSDLFMNNCDDFIYYDDLVKRQPTKPKRAPVVTGQRRSKPDDSANPVPPSPKEKAFDLLADTLDALIDERGENEDIWGSMIKVAIKRRNPGFSERAYGFRSFNDLLEQAQDSGHVKLKSDGKSANYAVWPCN
jgi:uncharacterized protein (TIGR00288 family)